MIQPTLFDAPRLPPHVAAPTSLAAAKSIASRTAQDEQRLLVALKRCGTVGMTDDEIREHFGWTGDYERPRRWSLVKQGLAIDSGFTRPTKSGREAVVWTLARKESK